MGLWEVNPTVDSCPFQSVGPGCSSSLTPEPLLPPASWSPSSPSVLSPLPQLPESSESCTASILAFPCLTFCSDSRCLEKRECTLPGVHGSSGTSGMDPTLSSDPHVSCHLPLHPVLLPQKWVLTSSVLIPHSETSLMLASRPRVPSHHLTLFLILQGSAQMPPPPRSLGGLSQCDSTIPFFLHDLCLYHSSHFHPALCGGLLFQSSLPSEVRAPSWPRPYVTFPVSPSPITGSGSKSSSHECEWNEWVF